MKVLVAMSGGVDSSVAAACLVDAGHEVAGTTMRLWGGESDTGCCSVADVDDARRVADQLGIDHVVFNFSDEFHRHVVGPYVDAHRAGITPNPCIECNRHLKFDRLLDRADLLGFDAVATGHHARVERRDDGWGLRRGADAAKDQSYVVHMLGQAELARVVFPVGDMTKSAVRELARRRGLRTAAKPDSQDVCFVSKAAGRQAFLRSRIPFRPGRVVSTAGEPVGGVDAVEMITVGQRRGLGLPGGGPLRYAVDVDVPGATVVVGSRDELLQRQLAVRDVTWIASPVAGPVLVQCSAHGAAEPADLDGDGGSVTVRFVTPRPRVAPGQSIVFYDTSNEWVLGGGIVEPGGHRPHP